MDNPKKHAADNDAKGDKPKKPKHFHAGPNPIAEEEKEPSQAPALLVSAAGSPIGRLDSDVLGVLFGFFTLRELHPLLSVCRAWSIVRNSVPPVSVLPYSWSIAAPKATAKLSYRFVVCTVQSLLTISSSRLARHISGIKHKSTLRVDSLYILALRMPQLIYLQCEIVPSEPHKMILPPKLETLGLNLSALDAVGFNRALEAIGQLTALTELTLNFSSWLPEMNLAPLSKCPALEKLTVRAMKWTTQPTDAHIDQLRALTHLRRVTIPELNSSSLAKLLRSPHSLQWMEMTDVANIDSAAAAALRNLPGLLTLSAWGCRNISFLPVMTQLQSLTVAIKIEPWAVTGDAVVEALSNCRQLTVLCLVAPVTSKHLAELLPHLTLLHTLCLQSCDELESLSFFSDVPALQQSLRVFQLNECRHPTLRSAELHHVLTLKELTKLKLRQSFADPLDGLTQRLLTPPSIVLPQLQSFQFEQRLAAADPAPVP